MTGAEDTPAWQRRTQGEQRWPASVAVLVAIVLQLTLPEHLRLRPGWLLPALEAVLLVTIVAANPRRLDNRHPLLRLGSLAMLMVLGISNAISAVLLVRDLLDGSGAAATAGHLLASGGAVYATNIVVFALSYWELDRGGPVARTFADEAYPDLLFPQLATPDMASKEWEPEFVDYLYVSFTNATAFSPTDTLPLTRGTKAMMALQSAVALVVAAFVVARAVNILQ